VKLTALKIHRFRGLLPGAGLTFHPSFNLLVGENGTGRTTLLELLARVLGGDFSGMLREPFSLEYTLTEEGMTLHVSVRNEAPSDAAPAEGVPALTAALLPLRTPERAPEFQPFIELRIGLEAPADQLVMYASATGIAWEVNGRPAYAQGMEWSLLDRSVWMLVLMTARSLDSDVRDRLSPLLRRVFLLNPSRFDESLGTFQHIGEIRFGMEAREDELFPIGLMGLPTWLPRLLRARWTGSPAADVIVIGHREVEDSFLARFAALAGFTAAELRVDVVHRQAFAHSERVELGRFAFRFTRRDGVEISQAQLGYGQKRLLSFLYYLDAHEDFAVVDGLTHGLHPRWISAALRALGERQLFVTGQSPHLFEEVPHGAAEELRAALLFCRTELRDGRERWLWSDPTPAQAEALFDEHRSGVDSLATLLQARGLW